MTAASADLNTIQQSLGSNQHPVEEAVTIYGGTAVAVNTAGYAQPAADTAGLKFAGIAQKKADNAAGADGAINVDVDCPDAAIWGHSGIAQADVGKDVYFADDSTVSETVSFCYAGKVARYISSSLVLVDHRPAYAKRPSGHALPIIAFCAEFDCAVDAEEHELIAAIDNHAGLTVLAVFGVTSEVFAGSSEDQGVVTVYDSDDTALATLTAEDGGQGADDLIIGVGASSTECPLHDAAATGDPAVIVAAAKSVYGKVTQATVGTPTGKIKVTILATPLAA